jgi:hypothetical protein
LEQQLTEALGNRRYAHAILLLVKNIAIERNALYAIAQWAAAYDPALLAQVILVALKTYGMFMSDIGDDWRLDGTLDTACS